MTPVEAVNLSRSQSGQTASTAPGQRIYVIGDIHGRLDLLARLYEALRRDLDSGLPESSVEVFLGDFIDRGPQSREVLDWLIDSPPAADRRICLLGNHEAMLLDALADIREADIWLYNGGVQTLQSYGLRGGAGRSAPVARSDLARFLSEFPAEHRSFLGGLPRSAEFGDYLFVHAGINPARSLGEQDPHDLVWIREPFLSTQADFGKVIVHGHTPVAAPDFRPNRINIDTGAFFTDRLTCLILDGATRRLIQTGGP